MTPHSAAQRPSGRTRRRCLLLTALCLPLAACGLPKDQRGETEHIRETRTIRVGVAGDPAGYAAERAWLDGLARELGASVEFAPGETHALIDALDKGEIDLVIGLPAKTPFKKQIGASRPYLKPSFSPPERIWAVRPGENRWLYAVDETLIRHARSP